MDEIKVSVTASTSQATAQLEDFGSRSKAAMEAYNAAASKSKTTSEALGKAFDQAMASGLSFTEAMEKATASVTQYTVAATGAAGATRNITSTFYAAQGASGLLEGRIPIRAMERFIAQSQIASKVLIGAFPLIGAIAIAEVVARATAALVDFSEKAQALATELNTDWLTGAIGQMTGLAKAVAQADEQIERFARDNDAAKSKIDEAAVQQARLNAELQNPGPKSAMQGAIAADNVRAAQIQKRIDALEKEKQLSAQAAASFGKSADTEGDFSIKKSVVGYEADRVKSLGDRKQQEQSLAEYRSADLEQTALIAEKENLILDAKREQVRVETTRPKKEKEPFGVNLEVSESIQEAREKLRALQEDTRAGEEKITEAFDRAQKAAVEAANNEIKAQREAAEAYRNKARAIAEVVEQNDAENRAAKSVYEAQIAASQASGSITKVAADQMRAADDAAYYADRIAELKQELAQLVPSTEEYLRVQRQLTQVQAQAKVSQITDQSKTAQDISQPYVNAFNTINGAWLSMQNKLIFGTKNVSQAFANMGVSILQSGAAWIEKWLAQQLAAYIRDQIAHQVSENTKLGQLIAAMATRRAITGPANAAEATSNTAVAATGAAASQAPIPIVGPELAAAAAASMTALLAPFIGLAAFETGGIIPNTGVALVHQGEGVLPRNLTNMLTSVANNYGGNSSSSAVHNSTFNANGITDRNFRDMARRHSEVIADSVRRSVRSGRTKLS